MTTAQTIGATVAGLLLATLPFWPYAPIVPAAPHRDHSARHGGQLAMIGDHHVELRRRAGLVEAFVSDARRRPLQAPRGWVVFDGQAKAPLAWRQHRLVAADLPTAQRIEAVIILADGVTLRGDFDFNPLPTDG